MTLGQKYVNSDIQKCLNLNFELPTPSESILAHGNFVNPPLESGSQITIPLLFYKEMLAAVGDIFGKGAVFFLVLQTCKIFSPSG